MRPIRVAAPPKGLLASGLGWMGWLGWLGWLLGPGMDRVVDNGWLRCCDDRCRLSTATSKRHPNPQINANQSSIPDWKVLAATPLLPTKLLPRPCRAAALLCRAALVSSVRFSRLAHMLIHPLVHSPLGNTGSTWNAASQVAGHRGALASWHDTSTPQPGFVLLVYNNCGAARVF